jgi:hypothetical protein
LVLLASNSDVGIDLIVVAEFDVARAQIAVVCRHLPGSVAAVAQHITEHRDQVLLIRCLVADPFGDNHLSVLIYDNLGIVGLKVRSIFQHDPAV